MPSITLSYLQKLKHKGEKITCLTAYDATFAALLEEAGIEVLLIGDSLGMAVGGHRTTIPVTVQEIAYHTRCVSRVHVQALLMADMPFASYSSPCIALKNAVQLMQAGAHIVKLEGGMGLIETIRHLAAQGIPSCAHLGLSAQAVHLAGGYKVQGRDAAEAQEMIQTALALEAAGAKLLVLECIPHLLAKEMTQALHIPTIGIGAGPDCDGQVLVVYDMLGLTPGKPFTFVQNFMADQTEGVQGALKAYRQAVKSGSFPTLAQSFV